MKYSHILFLIITQAALLQSAFAAGLCIDSDGDGWGWDGYASCVVDGSSQNANSTVNNTESNSACVDTDGDGWGWDGYATCIVGGDSQNSTSNNTESKSACVDSDGDGWGWNGQSSCIPSGSSKQLLSDPQSNKTTTSNTSSQLAFRADDVGECSYIENLISNNQDITQHVTDVVLTAGQSNAIGNKTEYEPDNYIQDQKDSRLIAWTSNSKWEIADPSTQTWDVENSQPFWQNRPKQYHNHPAFQIGKGILQEDPCRVVAIIATAATGQPIDYWLNNTNNHYGGIQSTVSQALQALPNKSTVDMIWWMQGEADEGLATTSPNTYGGRLIQLIQNFKSNSWYSDTGYFVANETRIRYRVNDVIRRLRNDGDIYTDYSEGEVLPGHQDLYPSLASEVPLNVFVHFNEVALRRIGNNVARKYSAHKGF